jgi:cytoskeleton protein RodZ
MNEPQSGTATAGSLLRAAREKQGLHIAALAAAIKVSQRKLEALENNRYDELPDATFTRALAQTVCRTLKIDARPVLDLLPPAPAVALEPGSGSLNTPFRERPGREEPGLAVAMRPMVWAAAALVLAAVAVLLAPADWWQLLRGGVSSPPPPLAASAPLVVMEPVQAAPQPASAASAAAMPASAAASQAMMVETVFAAQNPEPAASGPVAAFSPSAAPAAPASPNGLVQLRTSEASWVEVRDARGVLLLSRTVQPGESVGLDGSLPMRLVIGNAAVTQLGFRGKPVDLAPSTRDNVARVELR